MRMLACFTAAVFLIASISLARAEPFAYGVAYDELYRVDLGARQATFIGSAGNYAGTPLAALTGLSYGPGNELYAIAGTQKALVKISTSTGAAEFVGRFGLAGQGSGQFDALDLSMAYGCDGSFWMTSAIKRDLWKVNPQTAVITLVGNTGRQISGLAVRRGILYGTGIGSDQGLYTIDPGTAAATRVGTFGGTIPWIDPSFGTDGTLWATFSYNPPENREWSDLARIDPTTGAATNLGPITGPTRLRFFSMKGLAVAPSSCVPDPDGGGETPEPAGLPLGSPWALILLGLLLLTATARRLRNPGR
jgi:hypothetical protein